MVTRLEVQSPPNCNLSLICNTLLLFCCNTQVILDKHTRTQTIESIDFKDANYAQQSYELATDDTHIITTNICQTNLFDDLYYGFYDSQHEDGDYDYGYEGNDDYEAYDDLDEEDLTEIPAVEDSNEDANTETRSLRLEAKAAFMQTAPRTARTRRERPRASPRNIAGTATSCLRRPPMLKTQLFCYFFTYWQSGISPFFPSLFSVFNISSFYSTIFLFTSPSLLPYLFI